MTLRSPVSYQQLLFLACLALAPIFGRAQDVLILKDNTQIQGKVLGVSGTSVQVQDPRGTVGRPLAQIKQVVMKVIPPEFAAAQQAMAAKNFDAALTSLRALEKFKGLPADWAQQATAMLGDVYVEKNDLAKAEAAYADYQRLYPEAAQNGGADVGLARLAVAKKDFAGAKQKVEPVTKKALDDKSPTSAQAYSYSQAFLLLGQINEGEGEFTAALENYLRTVTIFHQDRTAVAQAQEKADALRKAHPDIFVP